jgi:hypothetical protein
MATGISKDFSGNQPRQMYKRNQCFEGHPGPHYQGYDDEDRYGPQNEDFF